MVSIRVAFCLVVLVVVAEAARVPREEKYTTKFDSVNVDDILKSARLLNNYVNCLLDKGKCTPDGVELKTNTPDALTNDCKKCSEIQKTNVDKVLSFLIKNKPAVFDELAAKYDPTGVYKKQYDEKLKMLST